MNALAVKIRQEKMEDFRFLSEDNANFVDELLKKFIEYVPTLIVQAEDLVSKNDYAKLSLVLHTIKGAIVSLGLEPADEYISTEYEKIRRGDYSTLSQIVEKLKAYVAGAEEYYNKEIKKG